MSDDVITHEPQTDASWYDEDTATFGDRMAGAREAANIGQAELARRMGRIIKNLRAFARNESEAMAKVDLVQVLETAVELTAARLRSDSVALDWTPPSGAVFAWGGEVRLVQVFVNLINNAADAKCAQRIGGVFNTLNL